MFSQYIVVGRGTITAYGPFATKAEARAFRKTPKVGLGSSKKYYRIIPLISGDFVTGPMKAQADAEARLGIEPVLPKGVTL